MIIKGVEFPDQLILDQKEGKLVIFAGAGVSLVKPSSLPDFVTLTEQIVSRKLKNNEKDKLDRVLGASKNAGVNVHRAAKEFINLEGSRPTLLHISLLNLFPDLSTVRVVTTNFDLHFSNAAKKLFGAPPEEYYAPALPLGNDFKGIVYLHGSLNRDEQRFVLTDSDFGRAYLTEGWATRFLWSLFRTYTVLFVGYSHNDPVMHYFSKGLSYDTIGKRYALTPEHHSKHWKSFDIIPLPYPVSRKSHKAMFNAVAAWSKLSAMGALDYEHRIKSIVNGPTHLSIEDSDFLLYSIKYAGFARFFAKHAIRIDWLSWAEGKDLLTSLIQPDTLREDYYRVLADWIADKFLIKHTDVVLSLIQRHGQRLNPLLWNAIAGDLNYKVRPEPTSFSRIVSVLLSSVHPFNGSKNLDWLLAKCKIPEDKYTALMLFEFLTTPKINLQRSFSIEEGEKSVAPRMELETNGDNYWLRDSWGKIIAPNIKHFVHELEIVTSAHLLKANILLKSYGGEDAFDFVSYGRSAIEVHEQDKYPDNLDVIIDAARDAVEWLIKNEPDTALCRINRWYGATPEIMKRIAIHSLAECSTISADNKVEWLVARDLLFDTGCVHEVHRVLRIAYPKTNEGVRKELLRAVKKGYRGERAKRLTKETKAYGVYSLLHWLRSAEPACVLAMKAFKSMQQSNPSFKPREYPDFHHWSGGVRAYGHISPMTVEELISKEPAEQLNLILTFKGDFFNGPDRDGLLNIITQAVQKNVDWGYKLAQSLAEAGEWDTDIWDHILRGWEEGLEDDANLVTVLRLLLDNSELRSHAYYIANLIQNRFDEKKQVSDEAITLAKQLADHLMDYLETVQEEKPTEGVNDWLQKAINHPGGKLASFWLNSLTRERKDAGDSWIELPVEYRRFLEKMIVGISIESQLARVFIASQLYFMFYMDAQWTIKHVLPLLDWANPMRARQCWDGYLFWGRYGENTLPYVMPYYRRTFRELHSLGDAQRKQFCEHMASIAIYSSINPIEDGWLNEFLGTVEETDRTDWAGQVENMLRGLEDDAVKLLWGQWLEKYWHRRNLGIPTALSPSELGEMVTWSACLGSVFDKAVKMICEVPAPEISDTYMFHLMDEKEFAKQHTKELAKLLLHIIPKIQQRWMCHELVPLAKSLRENGLDVSTLKKIQDALIILGCEINDL
ncbi:MAG: DUF4020 domain-containing protein [Syntrophobacteraceae bacterium]